MSICKYNSKEYFPEGLDCQEDTWKNSDYCILHMDFPEDSNSQEFEDIKREKEGKIQQKLANNDFDFRGAKLLEIKLLEFVFNTDINLSDSKIWGNVIIQNSHPLTVKFGLEGNAIINGNVFF